MTPSSLEWRPQQCPLQPFHSTIHVPPPTIRSFLPAASPSARSALSEMTKVLAELTDAVTAAGLTPLIKCLDNKPSKLPAQSTVRAVTVTVTVTNAAMGETATPVTTPATVAERNTKMPDESLWTLVPQSPLHQGHLVYMPPAAHTARPITNSKSATPSEAPSAPRQPNPAPAHSGALAGYLAAENPLEPLMAAYGRLVRFYG